MHNLCKLCIVTFLILLIFSSVEAQTNPVYLENATV